MFKDEVVEVLGVHMGPTPKRNLAHSVNPYQVLTHVEVEEALDGDYPNPTSTPNRHPKRIPVQDKKIYTHDPTKDSKLYKRRVKLNPKVELLGTELHPGQDKPLVEGVAIHDVTVHPSALGLVTAGVKVGGGEFYPNPLLQGLSVS